MAKKKKVADYHCALVDRYDAFYSTLRKDLGGAPHTIASRLKAKGIIGVRGSDKSCPLANYFKAGGFKDVEVGMTFYSRQLGRVSLPTAYNRFIGRFDDGLYPDLITPRKKKKK